MCWYNPKFITYIIAYWGGKRAHFYSVSKFISQAPKKILTNFVYIVI